MQFGASLKRKEDGRLVAGLGRYLDDLKLPDLLYLGLVRSPHAHARVLGVDRAAAAGLDGVTAVWTLDDLPELATASVPPLVPEPRGRPHRHPPLAGGRVRHAGEAVAVVVADDPYRLADALDRVDRRVRAAAGRRDAGRRDGAVGAPRPRRLAGQCART